MLSDVARGLAHLHVLGLVHRDIKPANVLLTQVQSGVLGRIGDFGVARVMEAEAATAHGGTMVGGRTRTMQGGAAAGTLVYMAPEYLKSATCTAKVDSFAFGLTTLVALTGEPAERAARATIGGETYDNLLELYYEEIYDAPDVLVRRLDPHADPRGGLDHWMPHLPSVRELHGLVQRCLEHTKGRRADVASLVPTLEGARAAAEALCRAERVVPMEHCCPLSLEPMRDPVVAADGNTYERAHLERWLAAKDTSPLTGKALPHKLLVPNYNLKKLIAEAALG